MKSYKETVDIKEIKEKVEKRIKTVMIGAIAAIEDRFGHLFGQDKKDLTEDELVLKRLFLKLRTDILNQGNEQIKKLDQDFSNVKYSYEWRMK